MEKFQLSVLFPLKGVGAASGLVCIAPSLYLISDNSTFLYDYNLKDKVLRKIKLLKDSQENLAKKDKADFESITLYNNKLYLFGSGSTKKRDLRISYNLGTGEVQEKDLSHLHKKLRQSIGLDSDELNIEGVIIDDNHYYLFQRGNGAQAQNGIFTYTKDTEAIVFTPIALPKVEGVEATFTDAILVNGTVYFLAACENTTSTYDDGDVYGSFIGSLDLTTKTVQFTLQITATQKFEGLTLHRETPEQIVFLLCEDDDKETASTFIYQLTLEKALLE